MGNSWNESIKPNQYAFDRNYSWNLVRNPRHLCLINNSKNCQCMVPLANIEKHNLFIFEYLGKTKSLDDEMIIVGRPLEERIGVHSIMPRWWISPTSLYCQCPRKELITVSDLFGQLLNFETHAGLIYNSRSVNIMSQGHGATRGWGGIRGC